MNNLTKRIILSSIISLIIILFTYNNYSLYKEPILKIDNIKEEKYRDENSYEIYYNQIITGVIQNGEYKGKRLQVDNSTSSSGVYDEQITKNTELFVEVDEGGNNIISISGIKRDKYIVISLLIFLNVLLFVGKMKGIKTIISLIINIIISLLVLNLYQRYLNNINILLLMIPIAIIFIIISLLLTNSFDKKTFSAITSSIISLLISFLICYIVLIIFRKEIPFWFMNNVEAIKDYENLFYVNVLFCSLGAIMDIAITLSSSVNELIDKDNSITHKALVKSGKEISSDIIGTMINVMLFTILASIIPYSVLIVKNNLPIGEALNTFGKLEIIKVLTSSISICIAVIVSLYISIHILKVRRIKK